MASQNGFLAIPTSSFQIFLVLSFVLLNEYSVSDRNNLWNNIFSFNFGRNFEFERHFETNQNSTEF
jgi:hypothetical protein